MERVLLQGRGGLAEWRDQARRLLSLKVPPPDVDWCVQATAKDDLFGVQGLSDAGSSKEPARTITVPRPFVPLAEAALCHSDPVRFSLLYRVLWRLQKERHLLEIRSDPDVATVFAMEKSVRRDSHKMKAFVRFKEVGLEPVDATLSFPDIETAPLRSVHRRKFAAWFEPDHFIVARTAPFFQKRFTDMDWLILTPHGSAGWDGRVLTLSEEPAEKPALDDVTDDLWRTYFSNIFNPARLKVKAMQAEMPKKYWKNLPEAGLIPQMIANAEASAAEMVARQASLPPIHHAKLQEAAVRSMPAPEPAAAAGSLHALLQDAKGCRRCPLYGQATQTVFGEGPPDAEIMFVGEQAGDQEDLAGKPFIGPAGRLLDTVLADAGIDRRRCYVTNAVKHFKYELRGKRRIHQRPTMGEVDHCRWWLDRERALIRPKLIVSLGATALASLAGTKPKLSDMRGRVFQLDTGTALLATVHPAYLLRLPDAMKREEEEGRFRADIALAAELAANLVQRAEAG